METKNGDLSINEINKYIYNIICQNNLVKGIFCRIANINNSELALALITSKNVNIVENKVGISFNNQIIYLEIKSNFDKNELKIIEINPAQEYLKNFKFINIDYYSILDSCKKNEFNDKIAYLFDLDSYNGIKFNVGIIQNINVETNKMEFLCFQKGKTSGGLIICNENNKIQLIGIFESPENKKYWKDGTFIYEYIKQFYENNDCTKYLLIKQMNHQKNKNAKNNNNIKNLNNLNNQSNQSNKNNNNLNVFNKNNQNNQNINNNNMNYQNNQNINNNNMNYQNNQNINNNMNFQNNQNINNNNLNYQNNQNIINGNTNNGYNTNNQVKNKNTQSMDIEESNSYQNNQISNNNMNNQNYNNMNNINNNKNNQSINMNNQYNNNMNYQYNNNMNNQYNNNMNNQYINNMNNQTINNINQFNQSINIIDNENYDKKRNNTCKESNHNYKLDNPFISYNNNQNMNIQYNIQINNIGMNNNMNMNNQFQNNFNINPQNLNQMNNISFNTKNFIPKAMNELYGNTGKDIYPYIKESKINIFFKTRDNVIKSVMIPTSLRKCELYYTADKINNPIFFEYSDVNSIQLYLNNQLIANNEDPINKNEFNNAQIFIKENIEDLSYYDSIMQKCQNMNKITIYFSDNNKGKNYTMIFPYNIKIKDILLSFFVKNKIPKSNRKYFSFTYNTETLDLNAENLPNDERINNGSHIYFNSYNINNSSDIEYFKEDYPGKKLNVSLIDRKDELIGKIYAGSLQQIKSFYQKLTKYLSEKKIILSGTPVLLISGLEGIINQSNERTFSSYGILKDFKCKIDGTKNEN